MSSPVAIQSVVPWALVSSDVRLDYIRGVAG